MTVDIVFGMPFWDTYRSADTETEVCINLMILGYSHSSAARVLLKGRGGGGGGVINALNPDGHGV